MKYYSTKEISNILGFTIKTIQKLIRDKRLNAFRIGNRYLVNESDLKLFIENGKL